MTSFSMAMCDFVRSAGRTSYREFAASCAFPALVELPPDYATVGSRIEFSDDPDQTFETVRARLRSLIPVLGALRVHLLVPNERGKLLIGSGRTASLQLPGTSPRHADLYSLKGLWRIRDRESEGGSRIENQRIPAGIPTPLVAGQYVTLGEFRGLFLEPRHLHGLARLAVRPRKERLSWPNQGLLLKDVLAAVARSVLPGPESGPYLLQVPVADARRNQDAGGRTQDRSEESLLELQRSAEHLDQARLFGLASQEDEAIVIGRGQEARVILDDGSVSRRHATLTRSSRGWQLVDLESQNGTYLRGKRLPVGIRVPLRAGQTVQFGGFRCVFLESDELCDMLRFLQQRLSRQDPLLNVA